MRRLAIWTVLAAWSLLAAVPGHAADPPVPRDGAPHAVPLYGRMIRAYDAPPSPYAAGHRGVDVAADLGAPVHASADGEVVFVGVVVGNRTVSVDHADGVRTTYSYLATSLVSRGQTVLRGEVIGTVGDGHDDQEDEPHVHLSARRDGVYFDPLTLYVGSSYADLIALVG